MTIREREEDAKDSLILSVTQIYFINNDDITWTEWEDMVVPLLFD